MINELGHGFVNEAKKQYWLVKLVHAFEIGSPFFKVHYSDTYMILININSICQVFV